MNTTNIAFIFSKSKKIFQTGPLASLGSGMAGILILSCLVNVLFLTSPIFMMQTYDRVLGSGNISTLIGLYAIAALMFLMFGLFDSLRQQISTIRGEEVAAAYDGPAFQAALDAAAAGVLDERTSAPEDVETVRGFITSPAMITFFDIPSIPFYFLAVMMLHPVLGIVTVTAATILAILAGLNNYHSRKGMAQAQKQLSGVSRILGAARQDAESMKANGMVDAAQAYWQAQQQEGRSGMISSMRTTGMFGTGTKALRMAIQSLVLAVGAWLAILGQLSPGAMIAASIVFSRSIAPIEQLLNNYKNMARARTAWHNIQTWAPDYLNTDDKESEFDLPAPEKSIIAEGVSIRIPGQKTNLLTGITTELQAGDVLAVLGPSGVGKTSLVRALVGAWTASAGTIRLDGAEISQWPSAKLGEHIGYLTQYTNLLDDTIAQNISRFRPGATSESVIQAAQTASVHEMILQFEHGYQTHVGDGHVRLSGGQRQRIGLARALYANPFLAVLDEPSAHLDAPGKVALAKAILERRKAGKITIITSHDQALLQLTTKLLILEAGKMTMSGPKDAVLGRLEQAKQAGQKPAASEPQQQQQQQQQQQPKPQAKLPKPEKQEPSRDKRPTPKDVERAA